MARLLVSCGEPSGDLYGAELVRELKKRRDVSVFGLGGDHLLAQGAELLAHTKDLAVVGLIEVLRHLPRIRRIFEAVLDEVERRPPEVAVLIDYPDFNLRLAKALRRRGVKVVYYVSPQIWAWRPGRIRGIAATVQRMLVIFPFERALYEQAGIPVAFVGHPLVDLVKPPPERVSYLRSKGVDPDRPVLTIAPGSRAREVAHNLPRLAETIRQLRDKRPDLQFLAAKAAGLSSEVFRQGLDGVHVVDGETHAALSVSTLAIVASGTVTVEAALLSAPMIVVYRLSPWTYALGRPFVHVPHYAMVNLIAGRRIVPELIQADFTPEAVTKEALALLETPGRLESVKKDLAEVRDLLGGKGASARAAEAVLSVWDSPS